MCLALLCLLAVAPLAQGINVPIRHASTQGGYEFGAYVEGEVTLIDTEGDGVVNAGGVPSWDVITGNPMGSSARLAYCNM